METRVQIPFILSLYFFFNCLMEVIIMSEWISVNDGLPEVGEHVLVFSPITGIKNDFIAFEENDAEDRFYQSGRVTHWMPLPDIPSRMNARLRIQDNTDETKRHLEVLEELRDDKKAWLSFYKEYGFKNIHHDEIDALIDALDFAIDFIKRGMKG